MFNALNRVMTALKSRTGVSLYTFSESDKIRALTSRVKVSARLFYITLAFFKKGSVSS